MLSGNQCGTKGTHDTRNIRTDGFTTRNLFEASKDCIIIEGTALNHDFFAQLGGIGYLDYLKQSVFDNGISQTGGNIRNTCTLLLGLFYLGIHEYGTTGTQVNGMLRKQSGLCEILYRIIQGFCKGFDKGTAAGGAGLI